MTGSLAQLCNGILLLITFFCCRLLWGTYQSVRVYQDIWSALHHAPASSQTSPPFSSASSPDSNIMHFTTVATTTQYVPIYLGLLYVGSNLILNTLNFYWFGQMIEALRKRFEPAAAAKAKARAEKASVTRTTGADGKTRIVVDETEVRRRKGVEVVVEEEEEEEEEQLPAVS
jgi:hypothetical protein